MDYEDLLKQVGIDSDQAQVFLKILKDHESKVEELAQERAETFVRDRLEAEGLVEDEYLGMTVADRKRAQHNAKVDQVKQIWDNNGIHPRSGNKYTLEGLVQWDIEQAAKVQQDSQFSTDQPLLIPRVVTEFVRESIEPRLVLTPLLTRINYSAGTHITFPATAGVYAADIPEGGEYPEVELDFAGEVVATIGKSGLAVKFTEEMIRYSQWDVMALHLREGGKALARHKEAKVATMIKAMATTDFDNNGGTPTTGRASDGTRQRYPFTLDDLLTMIANAVNAGSRPNALIMNPMGWLIFARDPVMRAFGFANGGEMWQSFGGAPGSAPQWKGGGFLNQPWKVDDPKVLASTYTQVPKLFPFAPFTIIVSSDVNYDATNNVTDIYLANLDNLGYLIVDEELRTEEWKDPARDIYKTKFRERYAVAKPVDEDLRVASNVVVAKGYDLDDLLNWQSGTGALPSVSGFDLGI